jgi:hypothetical protein
MTSSLISGPTLFSICENLNATDCQCPLKQHAGWKNIEEHRWPSEHMNRIGTLRDTQNMEPTFNELHPNNTRYESENDPVAVNFYPYNRSEAFHCAQCQQVVLKYVEAGGYYVESRARRIQSLQITSQTISET